MMLRNPLSIRQSLAVCGVAMLIISVLALGIETSPYYHYISMLPYPYNSTLWLAKNIIESFINYAIPLVVIGFGVGTIFFSQYFNEKTKWMPLLLLTVVFTSALVIGVYVASQNYVNDPFNNPLIGNQQLSIDSCAILNNHQVLISLRNSGDTDIIPSSAYINFYDCSLEPNNYILKAGQTMNYTVSGISLEIGYRYFMVVFTTSGTSNEIEFND